jgi:hypothetical protein
MTSNRKIEANRRNSRKSCGPRTAAGKAKASRNALKHGLAALIHRQVPPSAEVEEFACALCGGDNDPALFAQAVEVAESEMVLRAIRARKIAVIERLRNRHAVPLESKDPVLKEMEARTQESRQAEATIKARLSELVAQHKDRIADLLRCDVPASFDSYEGIMDWFDDNGFGESDAVAILLDAMSDEPAPVDGDAIERARKEIPAGQRDEHEAFIAAVPDLVRLERYERRAWSRKRREIEEFMSIKASRVAQGSTPAEERAA